MARILIVEDDSISAALINDVITKYAKEKYDSDWDLRVTVVYSGIEALEILNVHMFELIITDILMAKMDGWELIREIRKKYTNSELPIVVVSAIDGVELEYKSKRAGASMWFTKPIHPKEFSESIFSLIAER
jgi:CheY-like chemotaxis protein